MKIKKFGLTIIAILGLQSAFADVDIPCTKSTNSVVCPAVFRNLGKKPMLVRISGVSSPLRVLSSQSLPYNLVFKAQADSEVHASLIDEATQTNSCNHVFLLKEKNGKFVGEYWSLHMGGRPKLCGEGGSLALDVQADVDK